MGQLDIEARQYMSDNSRFADAFNFLLYDGKFIIRPSELVPLDTAQAISVSAGAGRARQMQGFRDVTKKWCAMQDGRAIYAVLGVENQGYVDYAMPARVMLYDAMRYADQLRQRASEIKNSSGHTRAEFLSGFKRNDTLLPVVTLVIHFGSAVWDGAKSLHEMLCPEPQHQ